MIDQITTNNKGCSKWAAFVVCKRIGLALRNAICLHELSDFLGMSPTDNDVVVAYGMLQQVRLQVDIERDLRAAEVVAVGHFDGFRFGDEVAVEFRPAPFK